MAKGTTHLSLKLPLKDAVASTPSPGSRFFCCQTLACVLINQPDELDIVQILS